MRQNTLIRTLTLLIALAVVVPAVQAALTVEAGSDRTVFAGEPVTIIATCNGTDDFDTMNLSASVNWSTAATIPEIVPDGERNGTIRATYTYLTAGTYAVTVTVVENATGAVACDALNVTVNPQPVEAKVAQKVVNQKSNGILTIFVNFAEWLGFGDAGNKHAALPDPSAFTIGNATPEKVNICAKDGGTLILKYRQKDLDLAAGENNLTVTGNLTGENGPVPVEGSVPVSVIEPGNGKKGENGNGYTETAQVKEKVKNQKEFGEAHQRSGGNAKGQSP